MVWTSTDADYFKKVNATFWAVHWPGEYGDQRSFEDKLFLLRDTLASSAGGQRLTPDFVAVTLKFFWAHNSSADAFFLARDKLESGTAWQPKNVGHALWPIEQCGPLHRTDSPLDALTDNNMYDIVHKDLSAQGGQQAVQLSARDSPRTLAVFKWDFADVSEQPTVFQCLRTVKLDRDGIRCAMRRLSLGV